MEYTDFNTNLTYKFSFPKNYVIFIAIHRPETKLHSFAEAALFFDQHGIIVPQPINVYEVWRERFITKSVEKFVNKLIKLQAFS
jgi:hypothetical protein